MPTNQCRLDVFLAGSARTVAVVEPGSVTHTSVPPSTAPIIAATVCGTVALKELASFDTDEILDLNSVTPAPMTAMGGRLKDFALVIGYPERQIPIYEGRSIGYQIRQHERRTKMSL